MKLIRFLSTAALASCVSVQMRAHAEVSTQEKALASRLFDEASTLMKSGKTAEACAKYSESKRLDPQLGTLLYLGECYAKVGKSASAWVSFKEALDIAAQRSDPRTPKIRERLSAIEKTVSNLTIVVGDAEPADLEIRQDGAVVGKAAWGSPMPIDPGEHTISATAKGTKPREVKAVVDENARTVTLTLPAPEYVPAEPATPAPSAEKPALGIAPGPAATDTQPWLRRNQRTLALVAGGVGVVGVSVGSAFGLMAKSKYDESKSDCNGDICGPAGHDARQSAFGQARVSTVLFGVGAAGLIGGAVLWLTAPKSAETPRAAALLVTPVVGTDVAFLSVQRSWQ